MNASPVDKRDEFLLHMYDAFWNNITRAENNAWTMIAVYGALIAGVGLAQTLLTPVGASFVLIVFGYLASSFSASANLWFRRNLTMIGRLESQFLNPSDYGFLLPSRYKDPRRFWTIENWTQDGCTCLCRRSCVNLCDDRNWIILHGILRVRSKLQLQSIP